MAENVLITPGTGDTIAADEILSVKYQRVKLIHGVDGTNDGDVAATNPLPVIGKNTTGTAHSSSAITTTTSSSIITTTGYTKITLYWDITAITGSWQLKIRGYDADENQKFEIYKSASIGEVDQIRKVIEIYDPKIDIQLVEDSPGTLTSSVRYYLTM